MIKTFLDKYFLRKIKDKTIEEDFAVIEDILGVPIILEEISGAWKEWGIFVKEPDKNYTFLSRDYSDPEHNGRGNIIISRGVSVQSILIPKSEFNYQIRFGSDGGGNGIYDETDVNIPREKDIFKLKNGWLLYDKLLEISGISKVKKIN